MLHGKGLVVSPWKKSTAGSSRWSSLHQRKCCFLRSESLLKLFHKWGIRIYRTVILEPRHFLKAAFSFENSLDKMLLYFCQRETSHLAALIQISNWMLFVSTNAVKTPGNLQSTVFPNLTTLGTLYKWNQRVFVFFRLTYFT